MCVDPLTALTIAGAVVSAGGAIAQGQQQQAAAENAAAWSTYNAQRETEEARVNASEARRTGQMRQGAARAAVAGSGVTMEGTPLDAVAQSAEDVELDVQSILYAGRTRALAYTNEAARSRASGAMASQASYWTAGRNLLTGLAGTELPDMRRGGPNPKVAVGGSGSHAA